MLSSLISRFADYFSHQEESRLMWPPVFLGIGAAIYFSLFREPPFFVTGALIAGCLSLFVVARGIYHRHGLEKNYLLFLSAIAILMMGSGFALSQLRSVMVGTPMIAKETRPLMAEAVVDHVEKQGENKGLRLLLRDLSIERWKDEETPRRVQITTRFKMEGLDDGDRISVLLKLTPPSPPVLPWSYDYARHFYFEGIGGLGFALSEIKIIEKARDQEGGLGRLRSEVAQSVGRYVSGSAQGIVSALMTGERAAISDDDWQALRASGLAHIISISGLHVAMVAAPVFFLVRLFLAMIPAIALRLDIKKISAFVALVACVFYVGFVLPSVPTTRALLMTGVALIAIMFDRSPFSLRLVGFSAILILVFAPESIWSASFQMSFSAVTAMVAVADMMRPVWLRLYREAGFVRKSLLYLAGAVMASFVASVATAPFVWFHFQQMAVYSVVGNMLAMPITGIIIMPMMIVSYILMPFGLEQMPLHLMAMGVDWLLVVARFVESLPGALISGENVPNGFLYAMSLAGLASLLFVGKWRLLSLFPLGAAILIAVIYRVPDVVISPEGNVMMVRDGEIGYFSTLRKERFVREQWVKHFGLEDSKPFPREGNLQLSGGGKISCDRLVCRIEIGDKKISYGSSYDALRRDCAWADYLVSPKKLGRKFCEGAPKDVKLYDGWFFDENGSVSFSAKDDSFVTARDLRGWRPWSGSAD